MSVKTDKSTVKHIVIKCPSCGSDLHTPDYLEDIPDGILTCDPCGANICPYHEIPLIRDLVCPKCDEDIKVMGYSLFEKAITYNYNERRREHGSTDKG